jgi:hypothetical protein
LIVGGPLLPAVAVIGGALLVVRFLPAREAGDAPRSEAAADARS